METKEILRYVDHTLLAQTATWDDIKAIIDDGIKYETGLAIGWIIWANETFVYIFGGLVTLICIAFIKANRNQ